MNGHRLIRLVVSTLILTALLSRVSALARETAPSPRRECGPEAATLRLYVVNEAGASSDSLEVARREAADIWAGAGLSLVWLQPPATFDPADGPTIVVMVRQMLVRRSVEPARASAPRRLPLGWVPFGRNGPANLIEVSFSTITARVMGASVSGRQVSHLPRLWQQPLVGRALGRVLAHEIGHWLRGRRHSTTGLMKAVLRGHELVDPLAPPLPREWTSAGPAPLLAGASRCEPPRTPLSAKPTV
jgi:hypothetical protein